MSKYIDAEKLKEKVCFSGNDAEVIKQWIDVQEPADVAPVIHAHWIHDGSQWKYRFICSNCGKWIAGQRTEDMQYCMGCGARMDEVVDYGKIH